ncbi:DUF3306 domain-containing protein [Ramlibacter monticola]|uniref:DUF3306 domain-containing protein n=1 Tax=Ramlibacter monticola TaxID=1926872 RepID=A0A937CVX5_9BURK|nr:DUF3306 domain-containing protein [Ramlibacter monticola]
MGDGFLGRWSRRKDAVRKGEEVAAEAELKVPVPQPAPQPAPAGGTGEVIPSPQPGEGGGEGTAAAEPPPTLEDAQSLTKDSDFTRFTKPDVAPEVRTAALKKLFADPHFNVMDGLDVYIDDYSKPDPLPPEMLRKLSSAKFLKLFDDEEEEKDAAAAEAPTRESAQDPVPENVAQSGTPTGPALPPADDHADPDLRLQQDDAPGRTGPGAGAG